VAERLRVRGDVTVPGDKSITHRALMLAAVASGESRLRGLLAGEDCRSTATVLRALGCAVPDPDPRGGEIVVRGAGIGAWRAPRTPLDCGNSGTTARLMMGLLASRPFPAVLTGDASLRGRPMRRITAPLRGMGAAFRELEEADRLPIEVLGGRLDPLDHVSPKASAQIKSAVLLAGLGAGVPVAVREPLPSRDHTERLLRALGEEVATTRDEDGGSTVRYTPSGRPLPALALQVPGDPSSAAFLLALAALAGEGELRVRGVGVNPSRTGFLRLLARMGARIAVEGERTEGGEPVADLVAGPASLRAIEVGADEVPDAIDELPLLAALAARAVGETRITGAAELRVKETDRIAAMVENLRAVGVEAEELEDGMVVRGTDRPLRGRVRSHGDHRIAMAFGVLGAAGAARIEIDEPGVVDVSFPGYWELLAALVA
jgi:3-phosphoshikimate 1-carboxyvinyltransferase